MISEVFGHHHQHHHSWYPTYCNIKGYLYTRGKLNLNICTKGCYFQFQCSVSIFKILTKNMFRFEKYFLVPVNWAIKGDLLKYPCARYCIEGIQNKKLFDMSCCLSLTCHVRCSMDIGWPSLLSLVFCMHLFRVFILAWMWICLTNSLGWAVFMSMNPFKDKMDIMNVDKVVTIDHISTTCWWYPAKYRSDKLLATHRFLIMYNVTGMKSLGAVFMSLSATYLTNVDQRWQR